MIQTLVNLLIESKYLKFDTVCLFKRNVNMMRFDYLREMVQRLDLMMTEKLYSPWDMFKEIKYYSPILIIGM